MTKKPTTDQLLSQVAELTADLQRIQAEFINYKRRAESERSELLDFAKIRVIREFLTVRDSFDQEQAHRPINIDPTWAASIDSVRSQFDTVMGRLGVERFESVGHAFDPNQHEAIMMEDGAGEYEVVIEELQPGYRLGKTIMRPAMVTVGRSDQKPEADQAPSDPPAPDESYDQESASSETDK